MHFSVSFETILNLTFSSIWLNEGFATYVESNIGTPFACPDNGALERFILRFQDVMQEDSLTSSHPISVPVEHPEDTFQIFDGISYSKGASVIRMMNHFIQDVTFRKGITAYLNKYMFGNARQDDLWEELNKVAHEDGTLAPDLSIKEIMDTWTLQMGYPVINVYRSFPNNVDTITLSQERFLLFEDEAINDEPAYKWWVPVTFTTMNSPDFDDTTTSTWMKPEDETTTVTVGNHGGVLLVNVQQTGFYRVNYATENWRDISELLKRNHTAVHILNRAQILDDSMNLARSIHADLDYDLALKQTEYLKNEKEYVPWSAALSGFNYLDEMLGRDQIYGNFASYFIDLLTPIYEDLGFDPKEDDRFTDALLRTAVVKYLCKLHQEECVANSIELFDLWLKTDVYEIDSSVKDSVYCTAISYGEEEEWNFLWDKMLKTNNAEEKGIIINSLGCSSQIWQLQVYTSFIIMLLHFPIISIEIWQKNYKSEIISFPRTILKE